MKELKLFICEYCGTQYKDKEKAKQCEKSHNFATGISNAAYHANADYPDRVQDVSMLEIKFGDDWISREKMEEYNIFLTREAAEKELETKKKEREVKRCPFCGSEVKIEDIEPSEDDYCYMAQCQNKECDAAVCFGDRNKKQFIRAWNRRVGK